MFTPRLEPDQSEVSMPYFRTYLPEIRIATTGDETGCKENSTGPFEKEDRKKWEGHKRKQTFFALFVAFDPERWDLKQRQQHRLDTQARC